MRATRIVEIPLTYGRTDQRALFHGAARVVHVDMTDCITAFVEVYGESLAVEGVRDYSDTELVFRFVKSGDPVYDDWKYGGTVCGATGAIHVFYRKRSIQMVAVDDQRGPEYPPL